MKRSGRGGFTLVELLAAVGIAAGVAVALAGLSWGVVRLAEAQSGRERVWRAEGALLRLAQDLACAYAPPAKEGEAVFSAECPVEGGGEEGKIEFWRPEERAAWSETYGVRRVVWEWKKSGKKGRFVLSREERPSSGPGTNFPVREVLLEGDFSMEAWFREAPKRPAADGDHPAKLPEAGEWVEGEWPPVEDVVMGENEESEKKNPLPGWVRVVWDGSGERRVVESVVQAAHFVPSMRGGVVVKEGEGGKGMDAMKGREGMGGDRPTADLQEEGWGDD